MQKKNFKSFAKINLFLNIGKKVNNTGLHNIQSLVFLINLFDEIKIKKNKSKTDKVKFYGKFSNKVNKNNTVTKSLYILRKKGFINQNCKYDIKIKKQIPVFSGFGGGSSNAAYLIKNLVEKEKLTEKNKSFFSKQIGSDLKLFFYSNQIFQKELYKITNLKNKINLYFILVYPFLRCSTKEIYSNIRNLNNFKTKKVYSKSSKKKIINNLLNEQNSLQEIVTSKFPIIKKILFELKSLKKCQFSRLTGSGSACFGVFLTKKSADLGLKKIRKRFPKFWCVVGKTI
ncbi:hypothetical protein N9U58_00620 [Pelagibacteraceae bacterium]|nr:hypothetical protein [Pelagibacteraceae bacterium]